MISALFSPQENFLVTGLLIPGSCLRCAITAGDEEALSIVGITHRTQPVGIGMPGFYSGSVTNLLINRPQFSGV